MAARRHLIYSRSRSPTTTARSRFHAVRIRFQARSNLMSDLQHSDPLAPKPEIGQGSSGAPLPPPANGRIEDTGSQALAEALRSSFAIVKLIMIVLVVVFFGSGLFTVPSQEKAIVLRFGR